MYKLLNMNTIDGAPYININVKRQWKKPRYK